MEFDNTTGSPSDEVEQNTCLAGSRGLDRAVRQRTPTGCTDDAKDGGNADDDMYETKED